MTMQFFKETADSSQLFKQGPSVGTDNISSTSVPGNLSDILRSTPVVQSTHLVVNIIRDQVAVKGV